MRYRKLVLLIFVLAFHEISLLLNKKKKKKMYFIGKQSPLQIGMEVRPASAAHPSRENIINCNGISRMT